MKKPEDNVEFAVFGDAQERVGTSRKKNPPSYMRAEGRMALYLTVAGLVEGGFKLADAGALVANEYKASGLRMEASSVTAFFAGMEEGASGAEMGEIATKAFGTNFCGAEEMALLRALPAAQNPAAVLRMAATLVAIQFRIGDDRVAQAVRKG